MKVQYLVKIEFNKNDLNFVSERNLPENYVQYIIMALESISLYNELII